MEQHLRVVQLNIGSLFEPDWEQRRHEIVSWLDHLSPDVVCLQEVTQSAAGNTAEWIAAAANGAWQFAFGGGAFDQAIWPDNQLTFGSAVLSKWPIEAQNYRRLGIVDDNPIDLAVPWEVMHARTAGLDVFATHLAAAPMSAANRLAQVVEIDTFVKKIRGTVDDFTFGKRRDAMPAILCGDFNAEPDSDEIRFMSGLTDIEGRRTYWQEAWRVAGEHSQGYTQDWRTNAIAGGLNIPRKRIDYVFVGDPFRRDGNAGRVVDAKLAFHTQRTGVVASDHNGLVVDIVWPDRPVSDARSTAAS
ncbi:MAG: hypothetical protein GXP35_18345 [Actinobacteria bacterium]|nr:hypothetical protein [Actinomycetota bacterium]